MRKPTAQYKRQFFYHFRCDLTSIHIDKRKERMRDTVKRLKYW